MSKVGRPRKFQSVEAMSTAIEAYFDKCDKREKAIVNKDGSITYISYPMPYTMSGLAETIGISRRRLLDYNDREDEYGEEFRPTAARARARVERNLEERLYDGVGSPAGLIFGLKNNYGWNDKPIVHEESRGPLVIICSEEENKKREQGLPYKTKYPTVTHDPKK